MSSRLAKLDGRFRLIRVRNVEREREKTFVIRPECFAEAGAAAASCHNLIAGLQGSFCDFSANPPAGAVINQVFCIAYFIF